LSALIDNNLLRQEEQPDGEPRFTMLETIRAYALERLEASCDQEDVQRRHAEYFATRARQIENDFKTQPNIDWLSLEPDLDNFRVGLAWTQLHGDALSIVQFAVGIAYIWEHAGFLEEGAKWCDEALGRDQELPFALQAQVALWAAVFAWRRNDLDRAHELADHALSLAREVGDARRTAWCLNTRAIIAGQLEGDIARAELLCEEAAAIFRELGESKSLGVLAHNRGLYALQQGDYGKARARLEEALSTGREIGSVEMISNALCDLAVLALYEDRLAVAVELFVESLVSARTTGWRLNVAYSLCGLASVLAARGELEAAARLLGASEMLQELIGEKPSLYAVRIYNDYAAPVLEQRAEPEIAAAWHAGRAMSEADAAAYALAAVAEPAPL
jgi:tetratricopeptide (TPR) repeat protein